MATILTVHGTFASGPETAEPGRQKWWQKESYFEDGLRRLVEAEHGHLSWRPVIWDGLNSETSRRAAGARLLDEMNALEDAQEPYAVIGHSHGGSVISAALMLAAKQENPLPHLDAWLTVGTPFIQTKKERWLFNRLGLIGKAVFVAMFTPLLVYIVTQFAEVAEGGWELFDAPLFALFCLLNLLPVLAFFLIARYREGGSLHLYDGKPLAFAHSEFGPRWRSLWHVNDEAVQGLSALKKVKLSIFSKGFAVRPLSVLSILIPPALIFALMDSASLMRWLNERFNQGGELVYLQGNGDSFIQNVSFIEAAFRRKLLNLTFDTRWEMFTAGIWIDFLQVCVFGSIMLILVLVVSFGFNLVSRLISSSLSRVLNPAALGQIRANSLGSDTREDSAFDAGPAPMWLGASFPPLPAGLGQPLQATSDAAVARVVPKFRDAIGALGGAGGEQEKLDMLSEYLTWNELIHTSYFDNWQFVKLLAYALVQTEGFRPTQPFAHDPEYQLAAGWYEEIFYGETAGK
ncbi:MAG: hypothetical protein AAF441_02520 [Pseudomonadota bacterium]